jgi:hypothetical protein
MFWKQLSWVDFLSELSKTTFYEVYEMNIEHDVGNML